jgi:hypothetical protein
LPNRTGSSGWRFELIARLVDGPVHLKTAQMMKDEELRSLIRKRGYRVLELGYCSYSDKKRDELYLEIMDGLGK